MTKHPCARPACRRQVPTYLVMCATDWHRLPAELQEQLRPARWPDQTPQTATGEYRALIEQAATIADRAAQARERRLRERGTVHECMVESCTTTVPGGMLVCRRDWEILPPRLREKVRGLRSDPVADPAPAKVARVAREVSRFVRAHTPAALAGSPGGGVR